MLWKQLGPVGTVIVISHVLVLPVIFRVLFTLARKFGLFCSSNKHFTRLLSFILVWGAEVSTPVQQYVQDCICSTCIYYCIPSLSMAILFPSLLLF
jgi:hypothetical protein